MPCISVMIPTYNRAHLLGATIESILAQTFTDFELVIVDDASTDNSIEVIEKYVDDDERVRLVVNEQNLGLVRNWNKCLDLAQGALVQIMQSDDLVDSDYFQAVSAIFDQYPTVGFVAATARYIDNEGRIISQGQEREPKHYRAGDEAVTALITNGYPHVSSIVVRRECFEKVGQFNVAIWHGPDMEMDARLASQFDLYHFGKIYTSFRRHGSNMGVLEYLRDDFLETDMEKRKLTLGYLSPEGRAKLNIKDIDEYVRSVIAEMSVGGAIAIMGYGRADLSRRYLSQALRLDPGIMRNSRFWRATFLILVPPLGKYIMKQRMQITQEDMERVVSIEHSLENQKSR